MRNMLCLRCESSMNYIKREKIQLGERGWFMGDVSQLLSGALEVDIYACSNCGKIEFYMPESGDSELPQKQCPNFGHIHDFDFHKCPVCKCEYF